MPKQSTVPAPLRRAIDPSFKPRVAYSRDDTAGAGQQPREAAKLLIVEDDFLVASQMEQALTDAGFAVTATVATADDAIEKAAAQDVALVIMDIRLAGRRDGVDAALELFQRHGIRVIFATAHADSEIRRRAQSAMPLGWLQKPYAMSSLVAAVRDALERGVKG